MVSLLAVVVIMSVVVVPDGQGQQSAHPAHGHPSIKHFKMYIFIKFKMVH